MPPKKSAPAKTKEVQQPRPPTPEPEPEPELTAEEVAAAKAEAIRQMRLDNLKKGQAVRLARMKEPDYKEKQQKNKELKMLNVLLAKHKDHPLVSNWSAALNVDDEGVAAAMVAQATHGQKPAKAAPTKKVMVKAIDSTDNDETSTDEESTTEGQSSSVEMPSNKRKPRTVAKKSVLAPLSETDEAESTDMSARKAVRTPFRRPAYYGRPKVAPEKARSASVPSAAAPAKPAGAQIRFV